MKTLLWLDDVRDPSEDDWLVFSPIQRPFETVWVKNYQEFVDWITENGLPDGICFDHDLGFTNEYYIENNLESPDPDKTGMDCAKWLVEYCMDNNKTLPLFKSQSANPAGRSNILSLLINFKEHQSQE